eukprot:scaffold14854_cov129-Isochrysis_galbana.AAC.10
MVNGLHGRHTSACSSTACNFKRLKHQLGNMASRATCAHLHIQPTAHSGNARFVLRVDTVLQSSPGL